MNAESLLARVEQIVNDLALLARAVTTIHDSLSERTQSQGDIAERLTPVRAGVEQVSADASAMHAELCDSLSGASKKRAASAPNKSSRKKR